MNKMDRISVRISSKSYAAEPLEEGKICSQQLRKYCNSENDGGRRKKKQTLSCQTPLKKIYYLFPSIEFSQ